MRVLGIIPARGGSKGIYKKNIANLAGQPLIYYSINASLNSKFISRTFVSSDDAEILKISKAKGAEVIERPINISLDTTPTEPVITHVLNNIADDFDYFVLLQPTSPLRTCFHIDNAFEIMSNSDADALISVSKIENKFLKSFFIQNNRLHPVSNSEFSFKRRQDLPSVYMPNGAIYIVKTNFFLETHSLYSNNTIPFVMDFEDSVDIDCLDDIVLCEQILKNEYKKTI